jgi:hypothetical protein
MAYPALTLLSTVVTETTFSGWMVRLCWDENPLHEAVIVGVSVEVNVPETGM